MLNKTFQYYSYEAKELFSRMILIHWMVNKMLEYDSCNTAEFAFLE